MKRNRIRSASPSSFLHFFPQPLLGGIKGKPVPSAHLMNQRFITGSHTGLQFHTHFT